MITYIVLKPNHPLGIWLLLSDRRIKYVVHRKLPWKPRLEKLFLPISDLQYEKNSSTHPNKSGTPQGE